jgi:hypothetical protein
VTREVAFCGLDVGITTTDAVAGWDAQAVVSLPTKEIQDSAEEALRLLFERAGTPPDREIVVAATGVGSRRLPPRVCGLDVRRISEITAIGRGGIGLAGGADALVASLGTGTAMVSVRNGVMRHVTPGNGVGEAVGGPLGVLPADGTASNFAKYAAGARREDVPPRCSTSLPRSCCGRCCSACRRPDRHGRS